MLGYLAVVAWRNSRLVLCEGQLLGEGILTRLPFKNSSHLGFPSRDTSGTPGKMPAVHLLATRVSHPLLFVML